MRAKIIKTLSNGGVGVLPTDTIYGLVGCALLRKTVSRIYELRKRNPQKPFIILIGSLKDLKLFGIKLDDFTKKELKKIWPNAISVVLPCVDKKFFYLHRGSKTLAFRLPRNKSLTNLLKQTGPLVAPSANPEGLKPAENIRQAKKYFNQKVDFYFDKGTIKGLASTLIEIRNKKIIALRRGAVKIKI